MIGVLITNGGPHSADQWAEATASHIVSIADHVAGETRTAAIKMQAAIIDILAEAHNHCQCGERDMLARHGTERLHRDLNPNGHLRFTGAGDIDETIDKIVAVSVGTQWETDFADPSMRNHLRMVLEQHLKSNMDIERSWHADRNIDDPHAREFLGKRNILEG